MVKKYKIDLIVGIPSYNEADSIGYVIKQVDQGLRKYFPQYNGLIINVDNYSPDGTKYAFINTKTKTQKLYVSTPVGIKGKGRNFYNLFKKVKEFKPKAVVVVDADLKSVTPQWIKKFIEPILAGYDFALPIYSRSKYDATITNHICYPLIYGLLKKDLRQPIGGDFAFSTKLASFWLRQKWYKTTREFGIDNFMTLGAIFGDFKICQVYLGAKIHKPSAPKLNLMFLQVADTFLRTIILNKKKWIKKKSKVNQLVIFGRTGWTEPQKLTVDIKGLEKTFFRDYWIHKKYFKNFLRSEIYKKLEMMEQKKEVDINHRLWTEILYDLILIYKKSKFSLKVIEALRTLYFGRVASFAKEVSKLTEKQAEEVIKKQAQNFYLKRDYLISKLK